VPHESLAERGEILEKRQRPRRPGRPLPGSSRLEPYPATPMPLWSARQRCFASPVLLSGESRSEPSDRFAWVAHSARHTGGDPCVVGGRQVLWPREASDEPAGEGRARNASRSFCADYPRVTSMSETWLLSGLTLPADRVVLESIRSRHSISVALVTGIFGIARKRPDKIGSFLRIAETSL
jgi:hypothetical protein